MKTYEATCERENALDGNYKTKVLLHAANRAEAETAALALNNRSGYHYTGELTETEEN